jgi:flagellar motor protein MotB
MITRLLKSGTSLLLYFCAATLLAQLIIVGYLWATWQLNREKVIQMLAIAQGIDLFAAREEARSDEEEIPPEEPSYQDWIDRRATMFRDVELREEALENALAQLKTDQHQLAQDRNALEQLQVSFQTELLALKEGAEVEGRQTVARILESIKPAQAKEQVLEMLDNDEIDEVVILLRDMADSKRSKIIAEFKTAEENEKISEVLRLIRQGEPQSSLVSQTLEEPQDRNPTGS